MNYGQQAQKGEKSDFLDSNFDAKSVYEPSPELVPVQSVEQAKEQNAENFQSIGGKAINASQWQNPEKNTKELGKVIDLSPEEHLSAAQVSNEAIMRTPFKKEAIKTGDNLSKEGIKETEKVIKNFEHDGNAADFYSTWQNMSEVNLENSWNRKLGENNNDNHNKGIAAWKL